MPRWGIKRITGSVALVSLFLAGCFFMAFFPKLDEFVTRRSSAHSNLPISGNGSLEWMKADILAEIRRESENLHQKLSLKIAAARSESVGQETDVLSTVATDLPHSDQNLGNEPGHIPSEVLVEKVRRGNYTGPRRICHYPETEIKRILSLPHDCKRKSTNLFAEGRWTTALDLAVMTRVKDAQKPDVLCVIGCVDHMGICKDEKCLIPLYIRRATSDTSVIHQMFENGELDIIDSQYGFKTVLDAGGNCGIAAALLATMYPRATIVSVEPSSRNYDILRLNTMRFPNVFPVKAALWPRVSKLSLARGAGEWMEWGFMVYESDKVPASALVEGSLQGLSVPFLLELFNLPNFDFVKMDIEGSEQELFTAAEDNPLDWVVKSKMIIMELHDWMKNGSSDIPLKYFESNKESWEHTSLGSYEIFKSTSWNSS